MNGRTKGKARKPDPLLGLQKQIYRSLSREMEALLGKPAGVLRRYERSYHQALGKKLGNASEATKRDLLRAISRSQILLVGDFHPYHQSQRAALRLLKEIEARFPLRPLVLGLEIFSSDLQRDLDLFSRGRITENELMRRSKFDERWGFPWRHFLPLLEHARDRKIRMLALNRPGGALPPLPVLKNSKSYGDLGARDEWTAGILLDQTRENPKALILSLFGEYHLAPGHLPARLKELSKINRVEMPEVLTLYQNIDELYWQIREWTAHPRSNLFRLSEREFCHFSGTPWTKLQALVNWVHGDPALFSDEELDYKTEFLGWMQSYGTMIAKFFKVPIPSFEGVDVYGLDSSLGLPKLTSAQMQDLLTLLQAQERIYERWYEHAWVYAPSLSENSAAELAAIHLRLHAKEKVFPLQLDSPAELAERTVDHVVGFAGSLLMNPRRKCDHYLDHESSLKRLRRNPRDAIFKGEAAVRAEVLRIMRLALGRRKLPPEGIALALGETLKTLKDRRMRFTFTRFLGHWLGQMIHDEVLLGAIPIENMRDLFTVQRPLLQLSEAIQWVRSSPRDMKRRSRTETL